MINVMYLILTAMLALNVSAEILRAFFLMEQSMEKTGQNINLKKEEILQAFNRQMRTQPDITKPYYLKAKEAERISNEFIQYVENMKNVLIQQTGGRDTEAESGLAELVGRDDIERHADFLINQKKGEELRNKVNETREKLLALLPPEDKGKVLSDLMAQNQGAQTWESFHFEHSPLAAVVAMLTKVQNDCKNTNHDILYTLFSHIGNTTVPVDRIEAAIVPKANYLMRGDMFEADIFLTAFSTRQAHEIYINGQKVAEENGKFTYRIPANANGNHSIEGEIWVRESDSLRKYPFKTDYTVFQGGASISADNTKVLYTRYDNPLTITVPGVAPGNVRAEISNGQLIRGSGSSYTAKVNQSGTIRIKVLIKDDFGNWKKMAEEEFKVLTLPKAELYFGGLQQGQKYSKAALQAQSRLVARTDQYIRGLQYEIASYEMRIVDPRNGLSNAIRGTGAVLSNEVKSALQRMTPGSTVIFDNVRIKNDSRIYNMIINTR